MPTCLDESPSEKEGKYGWVGPFVSPRRPSMKVPPKRKGNSRLERQHLRLLPSMKVPPKRKGNLILVRGVPALSPSLNESPSEKEGKSPRCTHSCKGITYPLNESPSEKEGKLALYAKDRDSTTPSMKVPPKRKGNKRYTELTGIRFLPQ